jgi:hypothetical protein
MVSPLTLPPSTTLLFSCAHHRDWSPSAAVISDPCQAASEHRTREIVREAKGEEDDTNQKDNRD